MPDPSHGAQRASSPRRLRAIVPALIAAVFAAGGLVTAPPTADASGLKVAIVVGPAHGSTSNYITNAKRFASTARSYGAQVVEVYSPNATWTRVKSAAAGANIFIYLGHGNGWPSPYAPFSVYRKDGLGLNATAGNGHANVKYYGEYYVQRYLKLAPDSIVVLNRLCYASGNSEWGHANPTKSTAIKRVDNYGAGFLRSGARAVFADGLGSITYILRGFLRGSAETTVQKVFWSDPDATRSYRFSFRSSRTPGAIALMDPYRPGRYYRSVIGNLNLTVGEFRS